MSFLAPLFLTGLAALALPLVLHLIRRRPRGRYAFSSLMFLSASPPRLTRRSRLDQLLLLLLRVLAVILLVLAFARPFFRQAANLSLGRRYARRVALVIDTSASMRRPGLWPQALRHARQVLDSLEPTDQVALLAFDDQLRSIVEFPESTADQRSAAARVRRELDRLRPGWGATDMGNALVTVADALDVARDVQQSDTALQIVLISDMQRGARLAPLQAYQWPRRVRVALRPVTTERSNASVRLMAGAGDAAGDQPLPVRVANAADATKDQLFVRWLAPGGTAVGQEMAIYVPPGQSRVVRMARPRCEPPADRIVVRGDECDFDNTFYVVPLRQRTVRVLYVGDDDADDPTGLRYYLQLALAETPRRKVEVLPWAGAPPQENRSADTPELVVVTGQLDADGRRWLRRYVEQGGAALLVPRDAAAARSLAGLANVRPADHARDVVRADYVLLGQVDLTHPLLAAFASPQYCDFTKIHFWNHRALAIGEESRATVVARFDDGCPALWEEHRGKGRLWVLASGWHPADSQLARSSKFVPLLAAILQQAGAGEAAAPQLVVGQPIELPQPRSAAGKLTVRKPDGSVVRLRGDTARFAHTDQPGIYQMVWDKQRQAVAVNLDASESRTAPMQMEMLEQYGVVIGQQPAPSEQARRQRQLRDAELEGRQKIWRWLLVAALGVLLLETWLGGHKARQAHQREGDHT